VLVVVAATEPELRGTGAAETLVCGIGPIDAASTTARALANRRPDAVLHVGIAGCRRGCGLEPGQIVIGSEGIYSDAGGSLVASRVAPDPDLLARARAALPDAHVRPIGTSARVGGTSGCEVEGMEGFAVLRAAALERVPAVEVRAISNEIEEADRGRWRVDEALAALERAVARLVADLG